MRATARAATANALLIYLLGAVERTTDAAILLAGRIVPVAPCRASFVSRNTTPSAIGAGLLERAVVCGQKPCRVSGIINRR
jgi:hypothetical protein